MPRNDGFDFSDGAQPPLDAHPDMTYYTSTFHPSHLQRNRTERRRLQGLQRSNIFSTKSYQPQTFMEKWDRWMINEGGKHLFFAVWVFLHLLVAVFGVFHYGLKDNLTQARATFGVTFSTSVPSSLL
jgi:NADPH oxidase 2